MSSIPPGSSSQAKTNANSDRLNDNENGSEREHRLELFGFDSLVNILGLKSMTGEQVAAPSSPRRDGEDASFTFDRDRPRPNDLKLGTMMGVFVPCLQNILGIIYYIRFSWIVGMAGIGESLVLVAFCGLCTFLTGISLSAIATNGAMKE
uniref:Amino acid permease/ SLC12A domain-containing protein n=1 Tax=Salix viminalis TaxID=40686 RepID=A0A6N2MZY6_SALVM